MGSKILIVLLALSIAVAYTNADGFLQNAKDNNEIVYESLLNYFEVQTDIDVKDVVFGVTRDYWNGMLNSYMGYDKNWKIGSW